MPLIRFSVGDTLVMKKSHPCSSKNFKVLRGGTDVRVKCIGCGRDMIIERSSLEKMIKSVISENEEMEK